jgi:hypothetical protein
MPNVPSKYQTPNIITFLKSLHRLSEDARTIEFPDLVSAMNAVALIDILRARTTQSINKGVSKP